MTGDLRQAQLGALTVSVSTQSSEKHGIGVLCDEWLLVGGETVSSRHQITWRWSASATHFCHESLDSLHNSIDAAEPDFAIPYSSLILVIRTYIPVGITSATNDGHRHHRFAIALTTVRFLNFPVEADLTTSGLFVEK